MACVLIPHVMSHFLLGVASKVGGFGDCHLVLTFPPSLHVFLFSSFLLPFPLSFPLFLLSLHLSLSPPLSHYHIHSSTCFLRKVPHLSFYIYIWDTPRNGPWCSTCSLLAEEGDILSGPAFGKRQMFILSSWSLCGWMRRSLDWTSAKHHDP